VIERKERWNARVEIHTSRQARPRICTTSKQNSRSFDASKSDTRVCSAVHNIYAHKLMLVNRQLILLRNSGHDFDSRTTVYYYNMKMIRGVAMKKHRLASQKLGMAVRLPHVICGIKLPPSSRGVARTRLLSL
jgi:hypothetical protein